MTLWIKNNTLHFSCLHSLHELNITQSKSWIPLRLLLNRLLYTTRKGRSLKIFSPSLNKKCVNTNYYMARSCYVPPHYSYCSLPIAMATDTQLLSPARLYTYDQHDNLGETLDSINVTETILDFLGIGTHSPGRRQLKRWRIFSLPGIGTQSPGRRQLNRWRSFHCRAYQIKIQWELTSARCVD
jgi:hypothetical protein